MFALPRLGDVTKFLNNNFRNDVYLITDDVLIKCNGLLLASRSAAIEEIIESSDNIPVNELSDNIPALNDCFSLIYGCTVTVNYSNYKSIFKFGKMFKIGGMMDGVLTWVSEGLQHDIFWEVYVELVKFA